MGNVHLARGELDPALAAYEESLALSREVVKQAPEQRAWLHGLVVSLDLVRDVHVARGELDRARAADEESLALRRKLGKDAPGG